MDRRAFLKNGAAVAGATLSHKILDPLAQAGSSSSSPRSAAPDSGDALFRDDFAHFPPGLLTHPIGQLNGAIQEYHYLSNRGIPLGPWANAIVHMDAWAVGDEDGKSYIEQHLVNDLAAQTNPIFITGDPEWNDYTVEVKLKPLSLAEMAGVVFRYHTNRHYYLFALTEGKYARLALRLPLEDTLRIAKWRELGKQDFPYTTKDYYLLKVENTNPRIRAYVNDKMLLEVTDEELLKGKAGITANIPARFLEFQITASPQTQTAIKQRIAPRDAELARLRAENPQPKLWKRFSTPNFGGGRSVRFGDLDRDGMLHVLIAQHIPRLSGDAHDQISCLTAVTLDGKIIWQSGRSDPRNTLLTNDLPFQIHDVDGDGHNEVVLIRDFKLQILDGRTGKLKRWTWMPTAPPPSSGARRPYEFE